MYDGMCLPLNFLIYFDTGVGNIYGKITGHDLVSGKGLVAGKLFHLAVVMIIRHQQILQHCQRSLQLVQWHFASSKLLNVGKAPPTGVSWIPCVRQYGTQEVEAIHWLEVVLLHRSFQCFSQEGALVRAAWDRSHSLLHVIHLMCMRSPSHYDMIHSPAVFYESITSPGLNYHV